MHRNSTLHTKKTKRQKNDKTLKAEIPRIALIRLFSPIDERTRVPEAVQGAPQVSKHCALLEFDVWGKYCPL